MSGAKYTHKRSYRDDHSVVEEVTEVITTRKVKKNKPQQAKKENFFNELFKRFKR